jgi:hypothetical protein
LRVVVVLVVGMLRAFLVDVGRRRRTGAHLFLS